jgi:hypothetical protein
MPDPRPTPTGSRGGLKDPRTVLVLLGVIIAMLAGVLYLLLR